MQACGPISLEGPIRARLCGPIQFADGISGPLWERRAVGNLLTRAKGYNHTCASTFFAVALLTEIDWLLGFLIESVGVGGQREISVAWLPLSDPNSSSSSHLSILFFPKYHQVLPLSWAISLFESKTFSLPPLGTELYFSFLFFSPSVNLQICLQILPRMARLVRFSDELLRFDCRFWFVCGWLACRDWCSFLNNLIGFSDGLEIGGEMLFNRRFRNGFV